MQPFSASLPPKPPEPPQTWILPVVAWVAKAYYALESVIRQLKLVWHIMLGSNSWGVTLPILSRPRHKGGLALPGAFPHAPCELTQGATHVSAGADNIVPSGHHQLDLLRRRITCRTFSL